MPAPRAAASPHRRAPRPQSPDDIGSERDGRAGRAGGAAEAGRRARARRPGREGPRAPAPAVPDGLAARDHHRHVRRDDQGGGRRVPGQARLQGHRRRRQEDVGEARRDDEDADPRPEVQRAQARSGVAGDRRLRRRTSATPRPGSSRSRWLFGDVTGTYDATTVAAVKGFQAKRAIPVTGEIDQRTMDRLTSMTRTPTDGEKHNKAPEHRQRHQPRSTRGAPPAGPSASTSPAAPLRWVVDGKVKATYDARFGSDELPTREGAFSVLRKSRDHVSTLYHTSMPLRDVLQRRPGGALLARLRGPRLQRQQPRLRERARLRRHGVAVRPGAASATRSSSTGADLRNRWSRGRGVRFCLVTTDATSEETLVARTVALDLPPR